MNATTDFPNDAPSHPAWRYLLASQTVSNGQVLFAHQADEPTRQLANFLRKEHLCTNAAGRNRHHRRYPEISTALGIHRDRSGGLACWLQALILAREPTQYIAERSGISREAVESYRTGFFSIGDRIDDVNYIVDVAIKPSLDRTRSDNQMRHSAVKLFAYFCGTQVVENLFTTGRTSPREQWRTPRAVLTQLSLMSDVTVIADAALGIHERMRNSPERYQQWVNDVLKRIEALSNVSRPRNMMERSVERTVG
jgi:hypothetical protein